MIKSNGGLRELAQELDKEQLIEVLAVATGYDTAYSLRKALEYVRHHARELSKEELVEAMLGAAARDPQGLVKLVLVYQSLDVEGRRLLSGVVDRLASDHSFA